MCFFWSIQVFTRLLYLAGSIGIFWFFVELSLVVAQYPDLLCSFEGVILRTTQIMAKYGVFSGPHFPVFGVNTEIYFPYLHWIRRFTEYSVQIQEITDQKKFGIWTLFMLFLRIWWFFLAFKLTPVTVTIVSKSY